MQPNEDLEQRALAYHRLPTPGKIAVTPTKPLANPRDLALAYSPGVAAACHAIVADPARAAELTARGNLVAVITNGTAVLGLGNIGPLAAKPVMEGKGVLFKRFAGIDVFDIEIAEQDPARLVDIIASLEPSFGGINLEDIKAPECFDIERQLRERMRIPVFHDDQHGTAIIVAAALLNGLEIAGKRIGEVRLVTSGAGAAALSCLNLLVHLGLPLENIVATDLAGVVYRGRRELMDPYKARFASDTPARDLETALRGADVFLGLSAGGVLKAGMLAGMARDPLVFALANPTPEIMPDVARAARPDAIIATGRSDFPNQVNNVLCFPYIFRGALDVGATTVNEQMMVAAARALAALAREQPPDVVRVAYGGEALRFGRDYLIPKPFDPRLPLHVATAVARAAMDSGVALRPLPDLAAYEARLEQFVFRSGLLMRDVFARARSSPRRVAFAEGAEERVLMAAEEAADEGVARPLLIGKRRLIEKRAAELGLRCIAEGRAEIVEPDSDPRLADYTAAYLRLVGRKGVAPGLARRQLRTRGSIWALLMMQLGAADAVICGLTGAPDAYIRHGLDIIGLSPGMTAVGALRVLILEQGVFFIVHSVKPQPTAREMADIAHEAVRRVRLFGQVPKLAFLSHSNFGASEYESAPMMSAATALFQAEAPGIEAEGEMQADSALVEAVRARVLMPEHSRLSGRANVLVMPSRDAASIAFNLLKELADGIGIGPMMLGLRQPLHILMPGVTTRGILNMAAVATVEAQEIETQ